MSGFQLLIFPASKDEPHPNGRQRRALGRPAGANWEEIWAARAGRD